MYSKGTVLDKTVEYLKELISQNEQLTATAKLAEKSATALTLLQNQIAVLEKENAFLRAQIIQFGIDAAASGSQASGGNRQLLNSPLAQSLLNSVSQSPQVSTAINMNTAPTSVAPTTLSSSPSNVPGSGVGQSPQNPTQLAAQQLLINLAQSLTNSPLLISQSPSTSSPLTQPVTTSPSSTHLVATSTAHLSASPGTPSRLNTNPNPVQLAVASVSSSPQPQHTQPQTLIGSSSTNIPLSSTAPVLGSLVQTLASLAGTTTTPSPSPVTKTNNLPSVASALPGSIPQPPVSGTAGGLSAAAAASLLNTLILAQSVLTSGGGGGGAVGVANPPASGPGASVLGDSSSVLSSIGLEAVATGDHSAQQ